MLHTAFIDFNSFFASVEQQVQPRLRGRPVGVVPVVADTTCCIAASYEAKAFGVRTGTGVREARALCPGIEFVLARHPLYVDFHQRSITIVDRVLPVRQVVSIDEMECELTGRWRERGRAEALARQIKQALRQGLGECMRVSIGIAPNTLLGKLASNMQKPDGLTVLELADIPGKLLHLAPGDINGIGPRMVQRLARAGIVSMAQLYAAPRELLHTVWGGVAGAVMYDRLRGQRHAARSTPTRSIGHSHVLPPDLRHPRGALDVLHRLTQKAAMRLRKQGFYATRMSLGVRAERRGDGRGDEPASGQGETSFCETQDTAFLLHAMARLWRDAALAALPRPKAVGVTLHGLVPASLHTPTLFEAPAAAALRNRARLYAVMDEVNRLHGKNALHFASTHAALDAAPMRIAFTRIPDLETES